MSLPPRHKRKASRTSVVVSVIFHVLVVALVAWVAARHGLMGPEVQEFAVQKAPEEKKPEEKKPEEKKPEEKPPDQKQPERPQTAATPPPVNPAPEPPPPDMSAPPPPAAPDAVDAPEVIIVAPEASNTKLDPIETYKWYVKNAFESAWIKPDGNDDLGFSAEVGVRIKPDGTVSTVFSKGSGDAKWDLSVKKAIASVKKVDPAPPEKFPSEFTVRFDAVEETAPAQPIP